MTTAQKDSHEVEVIPTAMCAASHAESGAGMPRPARR